MNTLVCPCCGSSLTLTATFQAKPKDDDPFAKTYPATDFPARSATASPLPKPNPLPSPRPPVITTADDTLALLEQCEERSNLGELNEFEESFVQNTRERLTKYGVERLIMTEKQTKTLRSIASGEKKR